MKLSNAQEKVMMKAKKDIDMARSMEYAEWLKETHSFYQTHEDAYQKAMSEGYLKEYWEDGRKGIVLASCNSRTLAKLEEMGLIEIVYDSNGETFGIDTIKVLNY